MVDQPQQVLEEDSVEVHEDGTFLPPDTISGSLRLRQDPEGVPLEDEAVDEEHAPLLPHHHAHGRLGGGGVDGREGWYPRRERELGRRRKAQHPPAPERIGDCIGSERGGGENTKKGRSFVRGLRQRSNFILRDG